MALRIGAICPDGAFYIKLAKALEAGDLAQGLREMNLNTFTLALAGLHRMGFNWELAAKIWGVSLSSLAVLPLYGWVRRQFDGRTALAACFLYAVHAPLVRWSPEAIRDPGFWLFFTCSIYLVWRAVTEVSLPWFLAAGTAITLAALTRFEGLFLLIPLALWSWWRYWALRQGRRWLLVGALSCAAVLPLWVILANLLWLGEQPGWTWTRLRPVTLVHAWLLSYHAPAALAGSFPDLPVTTSAVGTPWRRMLLVFAPTLVKGFAPVFSLLMFAGLWRWRRVWARRDYQPLFYLGLAVLGGMWIQLWAAEESSPRYVFPLVIGAAPFAGLGLLAWSGALRRLAQRSRSRRDWCGLVGLCPWCLMAIGGLGAALWAGDYQHRAGQAALGRWIVRQFGPSPTLVGVGGLTDVVNFYAEGECWRFHASDSEATVLDLVRRRNPHLVLLVPTSRMNAARCRTISAELEGMGFQRIAPGRLPRGCESLVVLSRGGPDRPPSRAVADRNSTSTI
jgi:hypothetical protein